MKTNIKKEYIEIDKNRYMETKERILRKIAYRWLDFFYNLNIRAEVLTSFRLLFALVTIIFIAFGSLLASFIFMLIYQFVVMTDYIDGKLAKKQGRFKERWKYLDFFTHYIICILFLAAFSLRIFLDNGSLFFLVIGLFSGFLLLLNSMATADYYYLGRYNKLFRKGKKQEERSKFAGWLYSFIRIEEPFSLPFIFVFLQLLFSNLVNFYMILVVIYFIIYGASVFMRFINSFRSIKNEPKNP